MLGAAIDFAVVTSTATIQYSISNFKSNTIAVYAYVRKGGSWKEWTTYSMETMNKLWQLIEIAIEDRFTFCV